jgi:hypothetical protein
MLIGKISNWKDPYGFIEVKVKDNLGWHIDRYFLAVGQVMSQTTDIHPGLWVRFEVQNRQPKPGRLPYARSAEVFETLKQLQDSEKGSEGSAA